MRVTMRTTFTGFRNGEPWPAAGETIDVTDHEAASLISNGYAKEAIDEAATEHDDTQADVDSDAQADVDDGGEAEPGSDADLEAIEVAPGETATLEDDGEPAEPLPEVVNLDELDREQLLAYADEHGIDVNRRLGEENLRAAIAEAPIPPVVSADD